MVLSSRWRDDARQRVQTPRQNIVSFAAPLSCRSASGTITQHTLSVWSFLPHKFYSRGFLPARGTLPHGIYDQTMWRCVLSRCRTVTVGATRTSHSSGARWPVRHALRQLAGILHANSAAAPVYEITSGRLSTMLASAARTPHPSLALTTLPSPRVCAKTFDSLQD